MRRWLNEKIDAPRWLWALLLSSVVLQTAADLIGYFSGV